VTWTNFNFRGTNDRSCLRGLHGVAVIQFLASNASDDGPCSVALRRAYDPNAIADEVQRRPVSSTHSQLVEKFLSNVGLSIRSGLPNRRACVFLRRAGFRMIAERRQPFSDVGEIEEVGRASGLRGAEDDFAGLGPGERDEVLDRLDAKRRRHHQREGGKPDLADACEVLERVVRQVRLQRRAACKIRVYLRLYAAQLLCTLLLAPCRFILYSVGRAEKAA